MIDLAIFQKLKEWGDSNSVDFNYMSAESKIVPFATFQRVVDTEQPRAMCDIQQGSGEFQVSYYRRSKLDGRVKSEEIRTYIDSLVGDITTDYGDYGLSNNITQGVIVIQQPDGKVYQFNIIFNIDWKEI